MDCTARIKQHSQAVSLKKVKEVSVPPVPHGEKVCQTSRAYPETGWLWMEARWCEPLVVCRKLVTAKGRFGMICFSYCESYNCKDT